MVSKAAIMFLFTATVASGHIIHRPKSHPHQMVFMPPLSGCPSPLEPAPLICKFMLPNQLFQYKPQLIVPSTYIPPLIVEKCDQAQLDIELPAPEKPVVIPEAPILPPITIPKFPVPMIVEQPIPPPMPVVEPCEPTFVPEVPAMDIPLVPELPPITLPLPVVQPEPCINEEVAEFHQPMIVPQSPELPPFVMPELPAVEVPITEPCLEDQPIPIVPIPQYNLPMPVPVIESTFIPEMPVVNFPVAPVLPPLAMPVLPEIVAQPEPCFQEDVAVFPPAPSPSLKPEEPVRVEVPIAEAVEDQPLPVAPWPEYSALPAPVPKPAEPCEPIFMPEEPKIPLTPELPSFTMPELPEIIPEPERVEILTPEVDYHPFVPQSPELPTLMMPQIPEPAMIAPCNDELPAATPEYVHPLPMPMIPELPKVPFHEMPAHIMHKPEEPCLTGEVAIAPQLLEPIMPIMPAYPELADPCEPSVKSVMKMPLLSPYFMGESLPMAYSFFNGRTMSNNIIMSAVPHMRHL